MYSNVAQELSETKASLEEEMFKIKMTISNLKESL